MKRFLLITNFTFFILHWAFSQNPLVKQWDYRFGGTSHDDLTFFQQTSDGGYILGGYSYSDSSNDKTQHNWDTTLMTADYWIVKIDSVGMKQWDKRFGGTNSDYLLSLQQTADHGYILGGWSKSDSSGDKTQPAWGFYDYWIVKTDSFGNKQWDKRFGGTSEDEFFSVQQTTDGGYILGGLSFSDSSGDKSQPNWDTICTSGCTDDFWVVKIDSLGIKQWDKRYGGTSYDELYTLRQTADGGYLFGGYSYSDSSGDKSQNNWNSMYADYWMIKTDAFGNKQWDKSFGGTFDDYLYSLQQTIDNGFILAGSSYSDSTGDKTQPNWDPTLATSDLWIVKTDSLGVKQWDKVFGGTDYEEEAGNISQMPDKGYLFSGPSYSNMSGNKSENNLGVEQTWIVKTDSLGIKKWDKTIFTTGHDELGFVIRTLDGCYAVSGATPAGIGGYKTQPNWDTTEITYDNWIVKFCDTTSTIGINQFEVYNLQFAVFPNPAVNELKIKNSELKIKEVAIFDLIGQKVFQHKINSEVSMAVTLNIKNLEAGIYFVEIISEKEKITRKFVKE